MSTTQKSVIHIYLVVGIFILTNTISFILGKWSNLTHVGELSETKNSEVAVVSSIPDFNMPTNTSLEKESVVASVRGSKYYFTWCSGASSLQEETKVVFASAKEAEQKGYSISKTCDIGTL